MDLSNLMPGELEAAARRVLPSDVYRFFASGSGAERTLNANLRAFERWVLQPRVLVDVSKVDTTLELFGSPLDSPLIVAPVAYQRLAHPEGELATAGAASAAGVIFTASTVASARLESIAAAAVGPKWFQLYIHRDRGLTRSLVERAERAGYRAIVLTVDAPVLGRHVSVDSNANLGTGLVVENFVPPGEAPDPRLLAGLMAARHDPSLTWEVVGWLKSVTRLPVLLKGVIRPDDAVRSIGEGADGVVVSNHGGRQLDGAPATLDALDRVVQEIGGQTVVLADGGIRTGADAFKMLSLGARAVMVGRPVIWGLAIGGREGAASVLETLKEDLLRTLQLAGCPSLDAIDRSCIAQAPVP